MLTSACATITETDRLRLTEMNRTWLTARAPFTRFAEDLEQRVRQARIVPSEAVDPLVITMNSRLRARAMDGTVHFFTLVYCDEKGGLDGGISVHSSLGTQLLGARVGDVVEWKSRRGVTMLRIEQLPYQPEAAGHFHL